MSARQAVRPAKRGGSLKPRRARDSDHRPSAAISAWPRSCQTPPGPCAETVTPCGWVAKSSTRMPSLSEMSSSCADRGDERGLQIAAMDDPVGRAVALLPPSPSGMRTISRPLSPGRARATPTGATTCGRSRSPSPRSIRMRVGIRRELDAGAGFLKPLGLLQHDDAKAVARQRQRGRQVRRCRRRRR